MFKINNNVNLNLKNLFILIVIILSLILLYNKVYIENNYVLYEKYKHSTKKYKNAIDEYITKINELKHIITEQNKYIEHIKDKINQTQTMQSIGNHTSAHNASLTPSPFQSSKNLTTPIADLINNSQTTNNGIQMNPNNYRNMHPIPTRPLPNYQNVPQQNYQNVPQQNYQNVPQQNSNEPQNLIFNGSPVLQPYPHMY
jgi:hypothetical protein